MAKVKLRKIIIAGLNNDRGKVLQSIQRLGVIDIKESPEKNVDAAKLSESKIVFERNAKEALDALEILSKYSKDEQAGLLASFEGPKEISENEFYFHLASQERVLRTITKVLGLAREINEKKLEIVREENKIIQYEMWDKLDISVNTEGTELTKCFIGSIKEELSLVDIYKKIDENLASHIDYEISIVGTTKGSTSFVAFCHKDDKEYFEEALKAIEFARPVLTGAIPKDEIVKINANIEKDKIDIERCEKELTNLGGIRNEIKFFHDVCKIRYDEYDAIQNFSVTDHVSILEGYIPEYAAGKTKEYLESKYDLYIEITEVPDDEEAPILLRNGFYADPMESVVSSYSYPNKSEIDPCKILSLFYYMLFGLMLSDAGYGLMLVVGCGYLLLKVKNMRHEMKQMMQLFFYGGIFTVFWGLLFGSFFGDAVGVIFTTFLNKPEIALKPLWFDPLKSPIKLLVFAFTIGLVHLFTGLGIKMYQYVRNGQIKDAIYDCVFWFMTLIGCILYMLSVPMITEMLSISFLVPKSIANVAGIIAIIGSIGVILTGGRESKNWFKRFLKGAYAYYGITGWLSDVLSYSRLLALGLATGVIAQVFNKMGSMLGNNLFGLIVFILVFIIGHILNLGINVLGAYVHTNRLQFVEFFGKFYEGGGKKFSPLSENTKYFNIKEDI